MYRVYCFGHTKTYQALEDLGFVFENSPFSNPVAGNVWEGMEKIYNAGLSVALSNAGSGATIWATEYSNFGQR